MCSYFLISGTHDYSAVVILLLRNLRHRNARTDVHNIESLVTFTQTDRHFKYRYNSERDGIYSLQFSYDANVLAVGYGDGTIEVSSYIVF